MTFTDSFAIPGSTESLPLRFRRPGLAARLVAGITAAADRFGIELTELTITQPAELPSTYEFPVDVRIVGRSSEQGLTASVIEGIEIANISDVLADDPPMALTVTSVDTQDGATDRVGDPVGHS